MNPALRRTCEVVRSLLATANADEVRTRHKVGAIILELRDAKNKYGAGAVATLAVELGRDQATLYRYARVAECWPAAALAALLLRMTPGGEPLSWSHLIEISVVRGTAKRTRLVEQAIVEGLSVREVARLARNAESEATGCASALDELRRFVAVTESLTGRAHWDMERATLKETAESLALLERAVMAQKELRELCGHNLERLQVMRERIKQKLGRGGARPIPAPVAAESGRLLAGYRSAS